MPKYYYPRIEEFHDGLDYVVMPKNASSTNPESSYSYLTFNMGDNIKNLLEDRRVKVRYLDIDDFILLGLTPENPLDETSLVTLWTYDQPGFDKDFNFKYHSGRNHLKITYGDLTLYIGTCPNVNEFKRLASRIGIDLPDDSEKYDNFIRTAEDNKE